MAEPCEWPLLYSCGTEVVCETLESIPASARDNIEAAAVEYLWNWTGRRFGACPLTIRPCKADCTEGMSSFNGSGPFRTPFGLGGSPWTPVVIDGLWYNVGCGNCGDKCGCGGVAPLKIPGPVASIASITEDGVTIDPANYHVENGDLLVRTDGKAWSACGLEITYSRGTIPPVGGQLAAGRLACELAKAFCNDESCELPERIASITRQGVTVAMLDSFDDIDKGHTGIWVIDSWVASVMQSPKKSRVLSPDRPRSSVRKTTWPAT